MSIGLLIIRVAVGATLAAHGAQKLFGLFRGHGIDGTAGFLRQLGFRAPRPYAYLLGTAELIGGALLAAGLLTPIGAAAITGTMIGAAVLVHSGNGFFAADNGYELPFVLGAAATAVAFTGPGRWSLDHALGWQLAGTAWGVAALAVAAGALAVVLGLRGVELRSPRSTRRPVLH